MCAFTVISDLLFIKVLPIIVTFHWTPMMFKCSSETGVRVTVLTAGCIWRLMAVSWTGWALREEWRAWGLIVEWKMVAGWLGVEGWCGAGLGNTGTGCWDGWIEAVCSSWPVVLWEPWLWWTTNCCCLCCWTRECGWIWVYAERGITTLIFKQIMNSANKLLCPPYRDFCCV